jgi:hypothetical protein
MVTKPLLLTSTPATGSGTPKEYAPIPPVAESCAEYDTPSVPLDSTAGAIWMTAPTRIVATVDTDSAGKAASVAVIVTLVPAELATVGAPVIWPVLGLIDNPGGRFGAE